MTKAPPLIIGVLTGDPALPYAYGVGGRFGPDDMVAVRRAVEAVNSLDGYTAVQYSDHGRMLDQLRGDPPTLVLNFCDTGYYNLPENERNVPALLELLNIPYTGADPACMGLCGDKALVRQLAAGHGIPVPNETLVDLTSEPFVLPELYPAMIKPNSGCGSQGITPDAVVHGLADAQAYLRWLATVIQGTRPRALIQDFLTGPEYTLGLVGNPGTGFTVLPVLEIDYSQLDPALPPILSLGSKADPDSAYWRALRFRQAELDPATHASMLEHATWLFERLDLRDYGRFDFRAGPDGVPRLLDANFNPTWSYDGKMAVMAGWAGYSYPDLLRMILEAARARYGL